MQADQSIWGVNSDEVLVVKSCPALYDPMGFSLLGSSVQGILQTGILEWVAIPFFRESSWPRDRIQVSWVAGRFFTIWANRKPPHPSHPPKMEEYVNFRKWGIQDAKVVFVKTNIYFSSGCPPNFCWLRPHAPQVLLKLFQHISTFPRVEWFV